MPDSSNINAGSDVDAVGGDNPSNQDVTNAVEELPESQQAGLPGIAELLKQLQTAIEADDNLQPEAKAEALKQVKVLASAGKNPQAEQKRSSAKTAIKVLKAMIDEIPGVPTLVGTWKRVLPEITEIFGLE